MDEDEETGEHIYNRIVEAMHNIGNDRCLGLLMSGKAYILLKDYLDYINCPMTGATLEEYFRGCRIVVLREMESTEVMLLTEGLIKRNLIGGKWEENG